VDRGRCYAVRIMNRENCEIKCHATGVVGDQCHFYVGGATVVETVIFTWVVPRWNGQLFLRGRCHGGTGRVDWCHCDQCIGSVILTWVLPRWCAYSPLGERVVSIGVIVIVFNGPNSALVGN
jgi:hypothetical protein